MNKDVIRGIKDSTPIIIGYISIAIAFGVISTALGLTPISTILMSIFVYAGASQFIAINLLSIGASILEIILTTFFVNLRHLLMSTVVSTKIRGGDIKKRLILAHGITDETFAMTAIKSEDISYLYLISLYITCFSSWVFGTAIGALLAFNLPNIITDALSFVLIAFFIVLLILSIDSKTTILVAIISFLVTPILALFIKEASIVITIIIGSLMGVCIEKCMKTR